MSDDQRDLEIGRMVQEKSKAKQNAAVLRSKLGKAADLFSELSRHLRNLEQSDRFKISHKSLEGLLSAHADLLPEVTTAFEEYIQTLERVAALEQNLRDAGVTD